MNKACKNFLLTAALASAPLTLYAVVADSALHISGYGYIGGANTVSGSSGNNFSVGYNNLFSNSYYSATVGYGLQNYNTYSLAVGVYNATTAGLQFSVGTGSSVSIRKNAFEVIYNGNVNVPISTTGAKFTVGNAGVSGTTVTTKIYGTAEIDRVPNKGGISMGVYLAQ